MIETNGSRSLVSRIEVGGWTKLFVGPFKERNCSLHLSRVALRRSAWNLPGGLLGEVFEESEVSGRIPSLGVVLFPNGLLLRVLGSSLARRAASKRSRLSDSLLVVGEYVFGFSVTLCHSVVRLSATKFKFSLEEQL